jgi:DHA3 family macrolide efflux protein-like MFS transporter
VKGRDCPLALLIHTTGVTMMGHTAQRPIAWQTTFFTIWTGQALSLFGSSVASFALIWWLTKATGSAAVLATATTVILLPGILLGPVAGALVDRWDRRLVLICADGFVALVSPWLAWLFLAGAVQPWHIYLVMFARSVGGCFHWPAMLASTTLLVPKEQLSRIAGLNETLNGAMNIAAPPLGAFLLALLPLPGIMLIDVTTALLAIGALLLVAIPQPERAAAAGGAPAGLATLWRDLAEGWRYTWSWPGLCLLVLSGVVANSVLAPGSSLLPLFITRHFSGGAVQLGWAQSAHGAGIVAGGLLLSVWGGFRRRMVTSRAGLAACGLALLLLGFTPPGAFPLALVAGFLAGLSFPFANGPLTAALQASVAPDMQGRVFTLLSSAVSAAAPLGLAVAAPVADALGVGAWYVIGGLACILWGVAGLLIPAVVNLEAGRPARAVVPYPVQPQVPAPAP